jgi:hypothetical protein
LFGDDHNDDDDDDFGALGDFTASCAFDPV